ncbi:MULTISPECIES: hypothetical protein [Pusillimonas]|uniref:hypothetical protein n=1 Tax=Pusillimonas TaxID=305976 RepID=UPI000E59A15D|nr:MULTISPECIES: hypothetical protein [Pusillimonas]MDX3893650.1 hypothetical protein [Pusillimonas sp.]TFL13722.1 hypothetical protein CSC67_10730 [Pusillimonas caeni]
MNLPDDPSSPPSGPPSKECCAVAKTSRRGDSGAGRSALRRRRLQMVRYLQIIACLRDETSELRSEIASLESIIGAQADAIDALRRHRDEPEE